MPTVQFRSRVSIKGEDEEYIDKNIGHLMQDLEELGANVNRATKPHANADLQGKGIMLEPELIITTAASSGVIVAVIEYLREWRLRDTRRDVEVSYSNGDKTVSVKFSEDNFSRDDALKVAKELEAMIENPE